jgi:hypothetical protein
VIFIPVVKVVVMSDKTFHEGFENSPRKGCMASEIKGVPGESTVCC